MKRVEQESFFKSFLLFFISLSTMITVITYINYKNELEHFDKELLTRMQLCNYSLNCKEFQIDFIEKKKQLTYTLLKNEDEVSSFYPINGTDDFYLKLFYETKDYHHEIHFLHKKAMFAFLVWFLVISLLSVLFSLYALYPLRNALLLTREFVKDILHDFNTPISTMRLNLSLLHKEIGENKKLHRLERSIENILFLQENLRDYLHATENEKELVPLFELIKSRIQLVEHAYPHLHYVIDVATNIRVKTRKKPLMRIIDNLLSNASKYNKPDGEVKVSFDSKKKYLFISDTGKGIKNPQRVFERFYKEHERGMGIGLHIVQKLCNELKIEIKIESRLGEGSRVTLGFSKILFF